ncbi:MAG TPA: hypothetical protein VG711_02360 [Phycisphaerales bacterium]|nr:hypothetical protein [Phycisphaerales bacterium]
MPMSKLTPHVNGGSGHVNPHGFSLNQESLDRMIMDRMHWASRFASAVAHDLGNVIFYSSAQMLDEPTMSDELRTCLEQKAELAAHLKDFVAVMHVWRNHETHPPVSCSLRQWWSMHGCMLRQFVTPPTRISLAKALDDLMLDAVRCSRMTAAVLTALDSQFTGVDRIVVNVDRAAAEGTLTISFAIEPMSAPVEHFLMPSLARELAESESADITSATFPLRLQMRSTAPRD